MTAAIHSLHQTYPGEYLTAVDTPCPEIFAHNPDVWQGEDRRVEGGRVEGDSPIFRSTEKLGQSPTENTPAEKQSPRRIEMHYPAVHRSNHELTPFLAGYTQYLGEQLGRPLRLVTNRPHLYLSQAEAAEPPRVEGKFWLVNAGVKHDFPLKQWPVEHYQAVVDHFRGRLTFVQIGERHHDHVPLAGAVNLIGKTKLRELIVLAYHAAGGLGPITFLQHLCAAWQKPYVALLGGREPVPWVTYPLQHTLHTIGVLDCCRHGGCWKGKLKDCVHPVREGLVRGVGECMRRIGPTEVIATIERILGAGESSPQIAQRTQISETEKETSVPACRPGPLSFAEPDVGDVENWLPLVRLDAPLTVETASGVVARVVERITTDATYKYPGGFEGRGIVTCAGGGRYLPCAWVLVRMLRHLGCSLPIECWHLGPEEIPDHWRELFEPRGVTFVDGRAVAERHPHPRLNGWELKPYAIRFSRFREVLFLDADNVPVYDPSAVFAWPEYARTGLLCWPDYNRLAPDRSAWRVFGDIPYRDEPEHETGQLVVDKARAWQVMLLANWFNVHSAFYYHHNLGDKETWHLAAHRLGYEFAIPQRGIHSLRGTMCQHDFSGRRIFQHRNGCKWTLEGNRRVRGFVGEADCLAWLAEAREAVAEGWPNMRENDRAIAASVQGVRWLYKRVGHDERPLVLGPEGSVGEGAADCERRWWVWRGEIVVADAAGTATFRCRPAADGGWEGRWVGHERMRVRLRAID